jgi:hypothetical protein
MIQRNFYVSAIDTHKIYLRQRDQMHFLLSSQCSNNDFAHFSFVVAAAAAAATAIVVVEIALVFFPVY